MIYSLFNKDICYQRLSINLIMLNEIPRNHNFKILFLGSKDVERLQTQSVTNGKQ